MSDTPLALDVPWVMVPVEFHIDVVSVEVEEWSAEVDHPGEGEVGEDLIRVTATDVGVYTRKPALFQVDG